MARFIEPFPSFEPNTHKHYILRHCINIVFIAQKNHIDSEHRKMRAKQQHVCKEMNQYTNNTNRKWILSFSIEWTIGANDRK